MTLQQGTQQLLFQLFHLYDEREARNIADLILENVTEWKRIDRIMNKSVPLSAEKAELLKRYIAELQENKPVQYVLGETWFSGMRFYVNENVLIPRPETEELVQWVLEDTRSRHEKGESISILDVGTGSGCIAIALKKQLQAAQVYSCEISERALELARKNAILNQADIFFLQGDFLDQEKRKLLPPVDIIVSNPPYIPLRDKETIGLNVLKYEPHQALFVNNDDPLLFYNAIAEFSRSHLKKRGVVFAEIHENLGDKVKELLATKGFKSTQIRKDLQRRDRMVRAYRE